MKNMKSYLIAFAAIGTFTFASSSEAARKKKDGNYSKAKKACLAEDSLLRGKELQKCIKGKLKNKQR